MKKLGFALVVAIFLAGTVLATDWVSYGTQPVRECWKFRIGGKLRIGDRFRGYVSGADSSVAANQFDFTEEIGDSTQCLETLARDTRLDVWKIGGGLGADTLIVQNAFFHGQIGAYNLADSTAILDANVTTSDLKDASVTTDKLADLSVSTDKLSSLSVTRAKIYDGSINAPKLEAGYGTAGKFLKILPDSTLGWDTPAGSGSGDVESVGTLNSYISATDSLGPDVHLGLNVSDAPAGADSFLVSNGAGGLRFSAGDGAGGGSGDLTGIAQGTGMTITNGGGPVPTVAFRKTWGDSTYVNEGQASSISSSMITDGVVSGSDLATYLSSATVRARLLGVRTDTLTVGAAGTIGTARFEDGSAHKVTAVPSASMGGDASFYWPVATGSTSGIYQKTATGAQITLSPTGLTQVGATTLAGTKIAGSGVSAADTSYVRQLHVEKFKVGGWGTDGYIDFQKDGSVWRFEPYALGGSGTTQMVYGSASTGNIPVYSVTGATEVITPVAVSGDATLAVTGALTLSANSVATAELANGAVGDSTDVAAGAITVTRLGSNSVYSGNIKDGQVKTADLAASAVDSTKIAAAHIPVSKIKANDSPANTEMLTYTGGDFEWRPQTADFSMSCAGKPTISEVLLRIPMVRAVAFPANFSGSQGVTGTNTTAHRLWRIKKNGSEIGTCKFVDGSATATFTSASGAAQSFAAGDVLTICAPDTVDATMADIGIQLKGTKGD